MMEIVDNFSILTFFPDLVLKSFLFLVFSVIILKVVPVHKSKLRYQILICIFLGLAIIPILNLSSNLKFSFFAFQKDIPQISQPAYETFLANPQKIIPYQKPNTNMGPPLIMPTKESVSFQQRWPFFMIATWILISFGLIVKLIAEIIIWRSWITKNRRPASQNWNNILLSIKEELRLKKMPSLFYSSRVQTPITYGFINPIVIVPIHAEDWSTTRKRMVLLHECVHIKRNDYLIKILIGIARSIHWFNPLSWTLSQQVSLECERSCDEQVVNLGVSRLTYASELLAIASFLSQNRPQKGNRLSISLSHPSFLQQRFKTLLQPNFSEFKAGIFCLSSVIILPILFSCLHIQTRLPILFSQEDQLTAQINKGNANAVQQILVALVERKSTASAEAIIPLLSNENSAVRASAAWALGQLKCDKAITPLTEHISDNDSEVQESILLSLAEYGYNKTFYSIIPLLKHSDPDIRKASLWALSQIGCLPAFYYTSLHLGDPDASVQLLARHLLNHWNRQKLQYWLSGNLKYRQVSSLCTNSLEGVIQLQQTDKLINCLAGEDSYKQQLLQKVLASKENEHRINDLKNIWGIIK